MNEEIKGDIVTLQRKLKSLSDVLHRSVLTQGQERFLLTYFEILNEYINKSFDIIDVGKYNRELRELE